ISHRNIPPNVLEISLFVHGVNDLKMYVPSLHFDLQHSKNISHPEPHNAPLHPPPTTPSPNNPPSIPVPPYLLRLFQKNGLRHRTRTLLRPLLVLLEFIT